MNNEIVDDLYSTTAQTTLILESPHNKEVTNNCPLVGDSGLVVSQGILPEGSLAVGYEIREGNVNLSVMNTFNYALQLNSKMAGLNSLINDICYDDLGPYNYKMELKSLFSSNSLTSKELRESYINRFKLIVEHSESKARFVICGFIAQAFFEFSFGFSNLPFGKIVSQNVFGKVVDILYVEHPSPKNNVTFWAGNKRKNDLLRRFVNGR